mgnify:CR=1 FL=1
MASYDMKRFLVLLSLVVLTNIPFSCVDDCGPSNPMESKITELYVLVGSLTSSGFITTKSTDFELAAIQIRIADLDYTEVMAFIARPRFSFINAAIACSPRLPEPTQAIESMVITSESTVYAQGNEFLPGEQLNELFKINGNLTIAEYITKQKSNIELFGNIGSSINLQLLEQPDSTINQTFTFDIKFSDLSEMVVISEVFEVNN